jgi:hypothetical protein
MGFYLRKSFKAGPLRFNLSKSGLGMSVGVKGARIGVSASGRGYVHAGTGGLYYRGSLGGGSNSAEPRKSAAAQSLSAPDDPFAIVEETDVTYPLARVPSASLPSIESTLTRETRPVGRYVLLPVLGLTALGFFAQYENSLSSQQQTVITVVIFGLLLLWPIPMIAGWRKNSRGSKLGTKLDERLSNVAELTAAEYAELRSAIQDPQVTDSDREYYCKTAYLNTVHRIVMDGQVTDQEKALLGQVEELFGLGNDFRTEARLDVFRRVYLECVADHALDQGEEESLSAIRDGLEIPQNAVMPELEFMEHLKEIRRIMGGEITPIAPNVSLQDDEVCYHESDARLLKMKTMRSFQSAGERYKVRALVVEKQGLLLITNKRLLLIHEGTTSIPLKKLLHVQLDYDRNLLALTKDGVGSAVYITTPDAYRAGALLSVLGRSS